MHEAQVVVGHRVKLRHIHINPRELGQDVQRRFIRGEHEVGFRVVVFFQVAVQAQREHVEGHDVVVEGEEEGRGVVVDVHVEDCLANAGS